MSIDTIRSNLKDYAKDIKINLGIIMSADEPTNGLTLRQVYLVALASSYATNNKILINQLTSLVSNILSDTEIDAAKAATTIMAMNNIYYRAMHLIDDKKYITMPANLRMNIIKNSGVEKNDFELMSLGVSAINGCGLCINAHVKEIEESSSDQAIQSVIKIASIINATAQALNIS